MYVLLGFKVKNMKMEFNNRATWRWAMHKQGEDLLFFLIWLIYLAAIENCIKRSCKMEDFLLHFIAMMKKLSQIKNDQ